MSDATHTETAIETAAAAPIPAALKCAEIIEEQARDNFCQTVLVSKLEHNNLFFKDFDKVLWLVHPRQPAGICRKF